MSTDPTMVYGIIIGACLATFSFLIFRDYILTRFVNSIQIKAVPTQNSKLAEQVQDQIIHYAKILITTREGLVIILKNTEDLPTRRYLTESISKMDEELSTLQDMGIVEWCPEDEKE